MNKFLCFGLAILFLSPTLTSAQSDVNIRSQCFDRLKEQALQIEDFRLARAELEAIDYATLDNRLSRYYQGHSSFGIDVDQPIFDLRVFSFGRQTGYVHPPYSPFPVGAKSEQWKMAAKEFILAEEFIRNPEGERQFLGCGFFRIGARDLKSVTADTYLYDGPVSSVMSTQGDHKFWYNFNTSFNYEDAPQANWYRLFVYPKATQNSYFSRYEVLDSFPGNQLDDLSILTEAGITARRAEGGDFTELDPVETGSAFALNAYYQAIAGRYPNFADRLALRGVLEYKNLQKILASPNSSAVNYVWDTLLDTKDITRYAAAQIAGKDIESDPIFDQVLNDPKAVNQSILDLALVPASDSGVVDVSAVTVTDQVRESKPLALQDNRGTFVMVVVLLLLLFVLLASLLFFARRHK